MRRDPREWSYAPVWLWLLVGPGVIGAAASYSGMWPLFAVMDALWGVGVVGGFLAVALQRRRLRVADRGVGQLDQ